MGYSTDLFGRFDLDRELTTELAKELEDFAEERHGGNMDVYEGYPNFWCQWRPTEDLKGIEWDGGEKFYNYVEWIELIIEKFLIPNGYVLNGEVSWEGEESGDLGKISVKDNKVTVYEGEIRYAEQPVVTSNNHETWMIIHSALKMAGYQHNGGVDGVEGFEDEYSKGDYKVTIGMKN